MAAGTNSVDAGRSAEAGGDYNLMPYPSLPVSYSQPTHLAALAILHGLSPPDVETAHVLELGCASGGNIIPLAVRFPRASFTGIDLASRQIDSGQSRIFDLGLTNIELKQGDVGQLQLDARSFDYIICHGLFSWVPPAVQDAILRLCRNHLAANGIAAISYNVLPGWHLRRVIRDICLDAARNDGTPKERVARARQALEAHARNVRETDPYGLLLKQETARLQRQPAAYILGEFLAPDNHPCSFSEFVNRASSHGLSYVCEGDLNASVRPHRSTRHSDRTMVEQQLDFVSGRPFRRSLLTRSDLQRQILAQADSASLQRLHFAADIVAESADDHNRTFRDRRGGAIKVAKPCLQEVLVSLAEAYPETRSLAELQSGAASVDEVGDLLLELLQSCQAVATTKALRVGSTKDLKPRVSELTRLEARCGQPWITTAQHTGAPLSPQQRTIIQLLDGTRTRDELVSLLARNNGGDSIGWQVDLAETLGVLRSGGLLLC